jgi:hypothetical protein
MLTDSSFKLLSCEESDTGLVHLELRKQGGGYDKGIFSIKLDPEFGWLVRDWSVRDQYGFVGTQHIYKNIYRSDPTATSPMIERIQIEEVANDGRRDTGTVKVELLDDTVDPDEFFSPYYGIPESAILPASKPRPWLRWILLGGGILCVLGGLWLKRGRGE